MRIDENKMPAAGGEGAFLREDLRIARTVRRRARAGYSNYAVGAVLKCRNGMRYAGCNIENHGIQAICAERVAFAKALSEGEFLFERILIVGGRADSDRLERCLPCGYCRQFMSEFVDKDFKIYTAYDAEKPGEYIVEEYSLDDLLPFGFQMEAKD